MRQVTYTMMDATDGRVCNYATVRCHLTESDGHQVIHLEKAKAVARHTSELGPLDAPLFEWSQEAATRDWPAFEFDRILGYREGCGLKGGIDNG